MNCDIYKQHYEENSLEAYVSTLRTDVELPLEERTFDLFPQQTFAKNLQFKSG